ncbi:hypothetical protein [Actinobacillus minor]|uniref:hypothetical protein n=1 Tax=Actinobacillus minor TaxID=51047 RepID=UPI0026EAB6F8|nr:hypothetical protein [Actinobacillus minor]
MYNLLVLKLHLKETKTIFRTHLVSVLLLSFVLAGNVYAETAKEKFDRVVQYTEQQNYQATIPIFKELAEQGYASAQNNLGLM